VATAGPDPTAEALRYFEDNQVRYLGYVDDLSKLLRASRMLVVTSRQRAGTPTKALQAMAAGTPVVGMEALLGIPDGRDHVTFSLARSWEELAERAVTLLTVDDYANRVGEGGRQLALRQHDWSAVLSRYFQCVQSGARSG
jgi:glycosyltransferase involved in cell wall biosynthesis